MKKNSNNDLTVKNDRIWVRIKSSLFHKELYNQRLVTFKITAAAIFLAVAVGLSLLEIFNIPTPWGATFGLRFFDTLVIIYSISIVGLGFALLEGIALPWIHNLIDGHHTWIEMAFFMISNILVVLITWFIYYILLNAYYKVEVPEDIEDHTIHEYHHVKKAHDHHHKIISIAWTKKILAFVIIVPLCALVETLSFLIVAKILVNTGHSHLEEEYVHMINHGINMLSPAVSTPNEIINWPDSVIVAHAGHNHDHDNNGMASIFESWQHTLIFIGIFFGIFIAKYIVNATLFLLLERRTRQLVDRYGIYV
ncbi:MAG: DUF898 domain-containing protein [Spiroplasma poulsonii]|uniref:Transmembrane protein n=1 Tax=Spiroplasma poulsonii TaxID=2138 RepID=A0A2P6FEP3_9MOLU|nr:hypothetical protein [Spiroplasma poulsonii]KAF0850281.1 putative transmembrane protein [Spiroplasma poulsonii]MBW1242084.1 DUF898 domain-containing protein [Spiroplasma poulsonii]PQM31930.1 hypothetical protein SMSRO_SF017950 [Spiroplasma poulsonii]PWF94397.1 hypothetical protein SMH99_23810 [Spiroplasma poulsonii]PWF96966.1 hypothetical protein SMSE_24130 [Spiroplasma poulsonii]